MYYIYRQIIKTVLKVSVIIVFLLLGISGCTRQINSKESSLEFNVREMSHALMKYGKDHNEPRIKNLKIHSEIEQILDKK